MTHITWCKENYEHSVTSRVWGATPYDAGWEESDEYGDSISSSTELRRIFEEEMALGSVPDWASEVIDRMLGPLPMCGHYAFPLPVTQICESIGNEACSDFVYGCYTAEPSRKLLMSYYIYCLDAWLKGAELEVATAELRMRPDLGRDWPQIVSSVYETLGEATEHKRMLVERLLHRLRWWIKTLIWPDDRRDRFMLDVYAGDVRGDEANWGSYGNTPFGDPYFAEREIPQMRELTRRIRDEIPHANIFLDRIESSWLCAPKVFRYLEKLIAQIGHLDPDMASSSVLQCEDTYPDIDAHRHWYEAFMVSLTRWREGYADALPELGEATPVKHWLVGILQHKLRQYEKHDPFGHMVGARPYGKSGTRKP